MSTWGSLCCSVLCCSVLCWSLFGLSPCLCFDFVGKKWMWENGTEMQSQSAAVETRFFRLLGVWSLPVVVVVWGRLFVIVVARCAVCLLSVCVFVCVCCHTFAPWLSSQSLSLGGVDAILFFSFFHFLLFSCCFHATVWFFIHDVHSHTATGQRPAATLARLIKSMLVTVELIIRITGVNKG